MLVRKAFRNLRELIAHYSVILHMVLMKKMPDIGLQHHGVVNHY